MVKFLWPLAMATLVAPMHAAAQTPGPQAVLTLRAALALAAQANPVLAAARYEAESQDGLVLQASARPNPTLSFERVGRSGAGSEADGEKTWQLSQPLELGGKRAARVAAAERGRDVAGAALEAQRLELHAGVVTAFYDVLVAQERLRLAQDGSELAQRATQAASKRVVAGKVSPVDETKARLAEANVRLEQASAAAALASARQRLAAYWQQPAAGMERPQYAATLAGATGAAGAADFGRAEGDIGVLPEPPSAAAMASWRAQSPALMPARLEAARRKAVSQLELANRAPDLTVSLGSKRMADPSRSQTVVGLSLPLPLFDRNQGNVLAAQRQADKADAELAAAAVRLESELALAIQDLRAARQAIDTLRGDILPAAQQASEAVRKGFEFGKHNFIDVLDAQRTLLQARAQYLSALSDGHRAAAAIERILGHTAPNNEH
ncbi:TolC family protein [Pseudoduganella sp. UC29_71]|jgi:cobalt-zinc-cadmium efflux system outer membrane protein|uniref:TolC family protein n=1 Tax=Pseudoduganella sp. UC29_71 TaxID=3350174 RepID=UPI00366B8887